MHEGFSFVRASRLLQSTFTIDLFAMIFGLPRALFPVLAVDAVPQRPEVVGLLFSAPAAGALVARRHRRLGASASAPGGGR